MTCINSHDMYHFLPEYSGFSNKEDNDAGDYYGIWASLIDLRTIIAGIFSCHQIIMEISKNTLWEPEYQQIWHRCITMGEFVTSLTRIGNAFTIPLFTWRNVTRCQTRLLVLLQTVELIQKYPAGNNPTHQVSPCISTESEFRHHCAST